MEFLCNYTGFYLRRAQLSNLRSELRLGDEQIRSYRRTVPGPRRDCPGLAQRTMVVEVVGPAEPPQGIDVRGWNVPSRRKASGQPTPIGRVVNRSTRPNRTCSNLVALRAARSAIKALYLAIHLGFHRMSRHASDARIYKRTFDLDLPRFCPGKDFRVGISSFRIVRGSSIRQC